MYLKNLNVNLMMKAFSLRGGKLLRRKLLRNLVRAVIYLLRINKIMERRTTSKMPLIKNAKPGSKGFKQNIETEINIGEKPPKQAVAIAYAEAKKTKKKSKKK